MKSFYYCSHCHKTFPRDEAHVKRVSDRYEIHGHIENFYGLIDVCCWCGSEDIDEIQACEHCGVRPPIDGADWCQPCIDDEEAKWELRESKLEKIAALNALAEEIKGERHEV